MRFVHYQRSRRKVELLKTHAYVVVTADGEGDGVGHREHGLTDEVGVLECCDGGNWMSCVSSPTELL
jgi:hypothetical protein